jgi:hypothetical protein
VRHLARVLCASAVIVALAACDESAKTPADGSGPGPGVFPLTITRTGGIAGFQDVLVVAGNGLVSVTRKGQEPQRCRLTPDAVEMLALAASRVPWSRITPDDTRPAFADDLVSVVQSSAGGPVRLDGPQAGTGGQAFLALLNDVSRGPTASRMCLPF